MQNFEAIARKLLRQVVCRIVVAVNEQEFGPNAAQSVRAQCAILAAGKELSIPGGSGKRRVATQARPNGMVLVGLLLSQKDVTNDCIAWRKAFLDEVRAMDEDGELGGWAVGRIRAFVAHKDSERSEPTPIITTDADAET